MTPDRSLSAERVAVVAMDAADALAHFRERFVFDDDQLIYLDGNSLGRLPTASRSRVLEVLDRDWGAGLIRSWDEHWLGLPGRIGDLIGVELLGAKAGEVIVADTTTVSLYKAVSAALDARPGRRAIVIERDNFPTDRYIVESLARRARTRGQVDRRGRRTGDRRRRPRGCPRRIGRCDGALPRRLPVGCSRRHGCAHGGVA